MVQARKLSVSTAILFQQPSGVMMQGDFSTLVWPPGQAWGPPHASTTGALTSSILMSRAGYAAMIGSLGR